MQTYDKPTLIFEYVCDNKPIGIKDGQDTILRPYNSQMIRKMAGDPSAYSSKLREMALRHCPYNQTHRVKCRIRAYTYVLGRKPTDGALLTLQEEFTFK